MIEDEHQPYDKSSKWLIQHHGGSILRLAGIQKVAAWRPAQAEVVQPSQMPDGLLEVRLEGEAHDDLIIVWNCSKSWEVVKSCSKYPILTRS